MEYAVDVVYSQEQVFSWQCTTALVAYVSAVLCHGYITHFHSINFLSFSSSTNSYS